MEVNWSLLWPRPHSLTGSCLFTVLKTLQPLLSIEASSCLGEMTTKAHKWVCWPRGRGTHNLYPGEVSGFPHGVAHLSFLDEAEGRRSCTSCSFLMACTWAYAVQANFSCKRGWFWVIRKSHMVLLSITSGKQGVKYCLNKMSWWTQGRSRLFSGKLVGSEVIRAWCKYTFSE